MNKRLIIANTAKLIGAFIIISLSFVYMLHSSTLTTVSPDSVRFMHFWQTNADQLKSSSGHVKSALNVAYSSLRSSNTYDMNRGRFIQYFMYGVDGLTRWLLPSPMINVCMILLLILNAALIAWVSTRALQDQPVRLNVFCLGWCVLVTSSFVMSPAMLLILYAKYLWVTFALAFFISHRTIVKVGWLAVAAFSDEIGLFAAMIITFLSVIRFVLVYFDVNSNSGYSSVFRISRACFLGFAASFTVLFVFYGISAVLFNVGAHGFREFSHRNVTDLLHTAALWPAVNGLLWRAEVVVLGLSLGHRVLTFIVGSAVLVVIPVAIWAKVRSVILAEAGRQRQLEYWVREWLCDEKCYFYTFWVAMLFLITFIIIPFGVGDYTHYSYPAAAVLSVLLVTAFVDVCPAQLLNAGLVAILAIHLIMLPCAVVTTDDSLGRYLLPDGTVSREDINAIKRSVIELRTNGNSHFFDTFNNGQEIDFSGTWFYSKVKGHGIATGPYFPIQGTVRVLLWPDRIVTTSRRILQQDCPKTVATALQPQSHGGGY